MHDHALGARVADVVEQPVAPAGALGEPVHHRAARCRGRRRRTSCRPRAPGRTRRGSAPCRAAPGGPASAPARGGRATSSSSIIARRSSSSSAAHLRHLVRGAEAVEEVQERDARRERRGVRDAGEVRAPPAPSRSASMAKPVWRAAITSEWSPKIDSACVASVRAATCMQNGVSSPAILYMLGIISSRPCEAVNVVASAPACSAPCTAPAAPPSDCISTTCGTLPQRFGRPLGRPLVGQLAHRRRGRDRIDRDHLARAGTRPRPRLRCRRSLSEKETLPHP